MNQMYNSKEVIPINDWLSNATAFLAQRVGVGIHFCWLYFAPWLSVAFLVGPTGRCHFLARNSARAAWSASNSNGSLPAWEPCMPHSSHVWNCLAIDFPYDVVSKLFWKGKWLGASKATVQILENIPPRIIFKPFMFGQYGWWKNPAPQDAPNVGLITVSLPFRASEVV